jgi:hypothetical protein
VEPWAGTTLSVDIIANVRDGGTELVEARELKLLNTADASQDIPAYTTDAGLLTSAPRFCWEIARAQRALVRARNVWIETVGALVQSASSTCPPISHLRQQRGHVARPITRVVLWQCFNCPPFLEQDEMRLFGFRTAPERVRWLDEGMTGRHGGRDAVPYRLRHRWRYPTRPQLNSSG